MKYIKGMEL